jgi:hypothetical protein
MRIMSAMRGIAAASNTVKWNRRFAAVRAATSDTRPARSMSRTAARMRVTSSRVRPPTARVIASVSSRSRIRYVSRNSARLSRDTL